MSDDPYIAHRAAPKWVHWFVNYAGLVVFLATLVVMSLMHRPDAAVTALRVATRVIRKITSPA